MSKRTESLAELCRQFEIDILYVFGSRALEVVDWLANDQAVLAPGPADVDVGVKPSKPFTVHDKVQVAIALEDFLGVSRVDLVSLPEADPFLAANIIRGERLCARDTYLADEYDLYILRRAGDLAPLERERMALILRENQ
jgi:predicted nucleotidyltransferase